MLMEIRDLKYLRKQDLNEFGGKWEEIQSTCSELFVNTKLLLRTAVAQWLRCCATNRKVAASIPTGISGFFIDIIFFRSHYGTGVDSPPNRNEYREHFLGVKAAGA